MIVDPALAALRSDDAPQREAQEALHAAVALWRGQANVAQLLEALAGFANGGTLNEFPTLAGLFTAGDPAAGALAADFSDSMSAALRTAPLGHLPLRHFTDGRTSTLLLARSGSVTLSLVAIDGEGAGERADPPSLSFGPTETWEHVLAGEARAEIVACQPSGQGSANFGRKPLNLAPGTVTQRDGACEARLLREIRSCLVVLRLQRRSLDGGPAREYALPGGALIHQAAGNPRDSRIELMLALLGRMERSDAAPLMAAIAQQPGSGALRWQALRECLALDTAAGFRALGALASAAGDELSVPAQALRAQLVEAYPQLEEAAFCPA